MEIFVDSDEHIALRNDGEGCVITNRDGNPTMVVKTDRPDGLYQLITPYEDSVKVFCTDQAPVAYRASKNGSVKIIINPSFEQLTPEQQEMGLAIAFSNCTDKEKITFEVRNIDTNVFLHSLEIIAAYLK